MYKKQGRYYYTVDVSACTFSAAMDLNLVSPSLRMALLVVNVQCLYAHPCSAQKHLATVEGYCIADLHLVCHGE